jgi:hypothetical protein
LVFAVQDVGHDIPTKFSSKEYVASFLNRHWKYQEVYPKELCKECLGEKVNFCWGDTAPFSIPISTISRLLKKWGWIKAKQGENEDASK